MAIDLITARRIRGFSQQALADASGVHVTTISKLERGVVAEPTFRHALRIARALNLQPEELWPVDVPAAAVVGDE